MMKQRVLWLSVAAAVLAASGGGVRSASAMGIRLGEPTWVSEASPHDGDGWAVGYESTGAATQLVVRLPSGGPLESAATIEVPLGAGWLAVPVDMASSGETVAVALLDGRIVLASPAGASFLPVAVPGGVATAVGVDGSSVWAAGLSDGQPAVWRWAAGAWQLEPIGWPEGRGRPDVIVGIESGPDGLTAVGASGATYARRGLYWAVDWTPIEVDQLDRMPGMEQ